MSRILVAFASRTGCTQEAAEIIAATLRQALAGEVEVCPVQAVADLQPYRAVVVGSAARSKRGLLREGWRWLRAHETELSLLPVAYFMTCWALREDSDAARQTAEGCVALVRERVPTIRPVAVGLFPGRMDLARFTAFDRFWLRLKHAPLGDWFEPERVAYWASALPALLLEQQ
jgi:menaquinone-dependent protoporphyrinogen oxidase